MKTFYKSNFLILGALVLLLNHAFSQNISLGGPGTSFLIKNSSHNKQSAASTCTDVVNYIGNTYNANWSFGGGFQQSFLSKARARFMKYPTSGLGGAYTGTILGVEFSAAKWQNSTAPNVIFYVYNLDINSDPTGSPLGPGATFQITANQATTSQVLFPSPIVVSSSYGFAVAAYAVSNTDSLAISSVLRPNGSPVLAYDLVYNNSTPVVNNSLYYFLKPIITISADPVFSSAKTSTGCGAPAVFGFTNNTPSPTYINNPIIKPNNLTYKSLDYGDGSPIVAFTTAKTHTYATLGSFQAVASYTYDGWSGFCSGNSNTTIIVNSPIPAFNYTTNGLVVTLNNTSGGSFTNYVWNFGDLSTSILTQPGTHTFSIPGTYVIELEGTAPCGKVRYSVTVTVPSNSSSTNLSEKSYSASEISIVPNPASNFIRIENKGLDDLGSKIEIYTTLGAVIKVISGLDFENGSTVDVEVSDLPIGVYFIKFKSKNSDLVKSFIKE